MFLKVADGFEAEDKAEKQHLEIEEIQLDEKEVLFSSSATRALRAYGLGLAIISFRIARYRAVTSMTP